MWCGAAAAAAAAAPHVEGEDGHGHVELVNGVDDDGGGGEEGEHEQEQEVDQHVAAQPADALHREVLPGGRGEDDVPQKKPARRRGAERRHHISQRLYNVSCYATKERAGVFTFVG